MKIFKKSVQLAVLTLTVFMFSQCCKEEQVEFNSFEKKLKIVTPLEQPMIFESANDTIEIVPIYVSDLFLNKEYCEICTCLDEYEDYRYEYYESLTRRRNILALSANPDGFEMEIELFFNDYLVNFNVKRINKNYKFFNSFFEEELDGFELKIFNEYSFKSNNFVNVVRITEKNDSGKLIQELIYQKDYGFLLYRNSNENIDYQRINL